MIPGRYLGLMSGTSMDAVDVAIVHLESQRYQLEHYDEFPYPERLRKRLEALVESESVSVRELGSLHVEVAQAFAEAALALMQRAGIHAANINAIGSHGQTLLHRPGGSPPFSLQIGDPSTIAWRTGILTVADFRAMDLAAGGQGAPLVPAFHRYAFGSPGEDRAVLNIGGIANLSLLGADGTVNGFDTGPGNTLLDGWALRHLGRPRDEGGAWARSGKLLPALLHLALGDPYFARKPPKSTGRDTFSAIWLESLLTAAGLESARAADVQCTLTELTARSIAEALRGAMPDCTGLATCGGGVFNSFLMERLNALLAPLRVQSTAAWGLPPAAVEASAFAWLAATRLAGTAGNVTAVTGALEAVCLGGIYAPPTGRAGSNSS